MTAKSGVGKISDCAPRVTVAGKDLPLELRNMVYLHLYPSAHVRMNPRDSQFVRKHAPTESCIHPPPPFKAEYTEVRPWWEADFVGQPFLDELAQHLYHSSTFIVIGFNFNEARRLPPKSPFGLQISPKDLIHNVSIRIQTGPGRATGLAGYQKTLEEVLGLTQTLKAPTRIYMNFAGPYSDPPRAANRSRAEKVGTDQALRVMTIVSSIVTRLKVQIRAQVDGVLFYQDLTKLSLGARKTKYPLFRENSCVYKGLT